MTAASSLLRGAFDWRLQTPSWHMAGTSGSEPLFMAPSRHAHLFKRADASYPLVWEDVTMKLGLAIGYSGACRSGAELGLTSQEREAEIARSAT
jgi:hypothetical protein